MARYTGKGRVAKGSQLIGSQVAVYEDHGADPSTMFSNHRGIGRARSPEDFRKEYPWREFVREKFGTTPAYKAMMEGVVVRKGISHGSIARKTHFSIRAGGDWDRRGMTHQRIKTVKIGLSVAAVVGAGIAYDTGHVPFISSSTRSVSAETSAGTGTGVAQQPNAIGVIGSQGTSTYKNVHKAGSREAHPFSAAFTGGSIACKSLVWTHPSEQTLSDQTTFVNKMSAVTGEKFGGMDPTVVSALFSAVASDKGLNPSGNIPLKAGVDFAVPAGCTVTSTAH